MSMRVQQLFLIGGLLFYVLLLSSLYLASAKRPVPENIMDILPPVDRERIRSCQVESYRFIHRCVIAYSCAVSLLIVTDGLKAWFELFPDSPIIKALAADGTMAVIMAFMLLTFRHVMKIREAYRVGMKTWKSIRKRCYICCAVLLLFFFLLFLLSITSSLENVLKIIPPLLPYTLILLGAIALCISIIYAFLFLSSAPFPDGELSDRMQEILRRNDIEDCTVRLKTIENNDRMNGCCMHLFRRRIIFLRFNPEEITDENKILAIMAHEAGHCVNDRQWASNMYAIALLVSIALMKAVSEYLAPTVENEVLLSVSSLLYMFIFMPIMCAAALEHRRREEYKADTFAVEQGYAEEMIGLLKNKQVAESTFLNPHPLLVKLTYTHPPISQRIAAIDEKKATCFTIKEDMNHEISSKEGDPNASPD